MTSSLNTGYSALSRHQNFLNNLTPHPDFNIDFPLNQKFPEKVTQLDYYHPQSKPKPPITEEIPEKQIEKTGESPSSYFGKVTFSEGLYLAGEGFIQRGIETIGMGLTNMLGLISTGLIIGAGMMVKKQATLGAIGIGVISLATLSALNCVKALYDFNKNNKAEMIERSEENMIRLGKNLFMLAISVPFIPKMHKPAIELSKKLILKKSSPSKTNPRNQ